MKARLVVKGQHVQGLGYRDKVMRIAREMHILGIIRNFDNGDVHPPVEIFCKCDEKTLQEFKRKINVKRKDPEHIFCPHVEDIDVYREGENEYKIGKVPEGFGFFEIEYGDFKKEILSSIDTFNNIIKHINQGLDKIDEK